MKRRDFIRSSALTAAALSAAGQSFAMFNAPKETRIGVGLFTLFGVIEQDVTGNLKKLKALGYNEVESAFSIKGGFYGLKVKEFAALTKEIGLGWNSHHVLGTPFVPPPGMKLPENMASMPKPRNLKENAQELVDEVAEGGLKYIVCASIDISTGDNVKSSTEILSKAGELAKKAGITLAYHNHDKEFATVDGIVPYDMFLTQLDSSIKFELDLAWVAKAGKDPVELFKKNPGRFPLWHVKDFDAEFKNLMPVGKGVIDFKKIFANAKTAGLEYPFVEHDMPKDAYASLTDSITYLKPILK